MSGLINTKIGAHYVDEAKVDFTVWAPLLEKVAVKILDPVERLVSMNKNERGYWQVQVDDVLPGTQYMFRLNDEKDRPDPASFFQPHGVHKPSAVVDHGSFRWTDESWRGLSREEFIIYELHVGTFTPEGSFSAIIPRIDELKELGVNAIELMPVAQFPGERNWGYDGVHPFAVQNSYGGPDGLKALVDYCHKQGMAVILDVVYNHLGPEGNYVRDFAPYFTDRYKTPWGDAVNFDDAFSDGVRNYFYQNALYWFRTYHIDALRLDAIHAIYDFSAKPFLQELTEVVKEFSIQQKRKYTLIAESDLNNAQIIRVRQDHGYGYDAQWSDDFHHSVHTLLTGEKIGYYVDFGDINHLVKALTEGFVFSGQYSEYRKRRHGNSAADLPAHQFVVCIQNHDQVGNRMLGDRLSSLVSFEAQKVAAGLLLLSPYIPLLFMGEEYGEDAPFLYFVSHGDPDLIKAVRQGRRAEFASFEWEGEPPDPQSEETFQQSKLIWKKRQNGKHKTMLNFYKKLIDYRKTIPALTNLEKQNMDVVRRIQKDVLTMRRWFGDSDVFCLFNLSENMVETTVELPGTRWQKLLDSSDNEWDGPGSQTPEHVTKPQSVTIQPHSFALYRKENA